MFHYVSTKISFKHTWMTLRGQKLHVLYWGNIGWNPKEKLWSYCSRKKCLYRSHWGCNLQFFFEHFGFLPFLRNFECHCLTAKWIFQCLTSHNLRNFDKQPWVENGEGFPFHSLIWQSGSKGEWHLSSWFAISNTQEKLSHFHVCCCFFSGKSLYNTAVYMIMYS